MILGHTLDEVRKAVVAFIVSAAALVALFVHFDPALPTATIAVALAVFNVVAVFNTPRHTFSDVSKTVAALVAATLALVAFFHQFNPGETAKIIAITGALVNVVGVFWVKNKGASAPPTA